MDESHSTSAAMGTMKRALSRIAYGLAVTLVVVAGVEILFRLVAVDPFYYWQYRFQFASPNSFENRGPGVWTYKPHAAVREVAVYGLPSGFTPQPKLMLEYDCKMRSNNLGLLQDNDIRPGTAVTLVLGDSFTSGQGGCPWFPRLQARRPNDRLLNGGLLGTGVAQWWQLLEHLRKQDVLVERVLIIAISNDFKRKVWTWTAADLDCIDRGVCTVEGAYSWQAVRADETQDELIARTRERYAKRFERYTVWSFGALFLEQHSLLLKFINIAVKNLSALMNPASAGGLPETGAALAGFKALGIPLKVLMVTQRNEIGLMANEADARAAEAALEAHGLPYDWCRLGEADYLIVDGHPNAAGYDKLMACADRTLNGTK